MPSWFRESGVGALVAITMVAGLAAQTAPPRETPSADMVLFKAADALGMLRGLKQEDSLTTLEFWATGTMAGDKGAERLSEYRGSVRFHTAPSLRADARLAAAGAARLVHVVAGPLAWNESAPGVYAGPATAAAASERLLRVLSLPHGVVKTARAAGPQTTVAVKGDRTILTFPVTALDGARMAATFTHQFLVERVEATLGDLTLETVYDQYGDWNDRDYKSDVQFPRRIVQRRGSVTVLDLTVTRTNTYNPYVVMPVPAEVKSATAKPGGPS